MTSVCVVLPAYNEEANIGTLIEQIQAMAAGVSYLVSVIVVDDGSADETAARVRALPSQAQLRLITHSANQGLARAVETGLRSALSDAPEVVITLDADNTQDPKYIPRLVDRIHEGHDVVIASRFAAAGDEVGVPLRRMALSHGASWVFRALFRMRGVRDYTCGYRAYRRETLDAAFQRYGDRFIEARGFGVMAEILLKLRRLPVRCAEVGFVLRYDFKGGDSKLRLGPTLLDYLTVIRRNLGRT